nr:calmodulin [Hymenolepis microstoma]
MSENRHQYLKVLKMADEDHSGALGRQELKEALMSQGINVSNVHMIPALDDRIIDYDGNGNKRLNKMNFLDIPMSGNRHKYLRAFQMADKDNSGSLDRAELVSALESQGLPTTDVEKLMTQLDINGDGIIHLSEYEIALGISNQPMEAWKQLFAELDSDGSGTVDFNELCQFLKNSGSEGLIPILDDWMEEFDSKVCYLLLLLLLLLESSFIVIANFVQTLMDYLDINGDEFIHLHEQEITFEIK